MIWKMKIHKMEYSKKNPSQHKSYFVFEYGTFQEYSKNIASYGIFFCFVLFFLVCNLPFFYITTFFCSLLEYGIFQNNCITTKNLKNLEYGILFLEYSKNNITTLGGVKFNQGKNVTMILLLCWSWSSGFLI